jgi:hypothetical protein
MTPVSFADSTLNTGVTLIRKIYIEQLRSGVTRAAGAGGGTVSDEIGIDATARLDEANRTGNESVDLYSGNVNRSLPLLKLKGRAGLALGSLARLQLFDLDGRWRERQVQYRQRLSHVPAQGLIFARHHRSGTPFVSWTQRNPLGITETSRGVYDPLGNYIPFRR